MSHLIFNKRGIGLIEVVIAIFLVTVGVLAILSMQPSAWKAVGKSDYLGRGAGILHRELEARESWIMNPCNAVSTGNRPAQTITVSGLTGSVNGDATYTVNTNITALAGSTNAWTVTTTVTWPNQLAYGYRNLSESLLASRQENFRFSPPNNTSCSDNTNAVPAGW
jgi:Tfp pilus assembly protein PilV